MANDVQSQFVPFGELRPDSGEFGNSDLVTAVGVYPIGDIYLPLQPIYARTADFGIGSTPGLVRGHVNQSQRVVQASNRALTFAGGNIYIAVAGKLYAVTDDVTPWAVSGSLGGPFTVDDDSGVFCGFGRHELFTCGHTSKMQIRVLGAGNFADCITTPAAAPLPKYVCVIGERILIANLANCTAAGLGTPDVNPNMVWWSATRDPRIFGNAASHPDLRTGSNAMNDDFGDIMALAGNKEYCLIFKRRAIIRMDFGGAYAFSFRWIPQSIGTVSHLSVCQLGRDTYFWGDPGPCVYRDDQVIPLAYGKVALELLETRFSGANNLPSIIGCGTDPVNNLVWWVYTYFDDENNPSLGEDPSEVADFRIRKIVYSPMTDRFSMALDMPIDSHTRILTDGGGSAEADIVGCWSGLNMAGLPLAAGVLAIANVTDNTTKLYTYSGKLGDRWWNQKLSLSTGYFALTPRGSSTVQRVRAVVRAKRNASIPNFRVTVNVKRKPWENPTSFGPFYLSRDGDDRGFISCPGVGAAQLVQIVLEIMPLAGTGGEAIAPETNPFSLLREFEGLQIEFVPGGITGR